MEISPIAYAKNGFTEKFGIPRQSGLVEEVVSRIVVKKEYSVREAFRGLEGFSHIWLIWGFSEAVREKWSPTVRPPRLGGNKRVGVFATRSPFRPNSLGISCVRLCSIEHGENTVLTVAGADMMNGTPVYDIKPYLPFTDSRPDAVDGFAGDVAGNNAEVVFTCAAADCAKRLGLSENTLSAIKALLREDPRPHYHESADRIYKMTFGDLNIAFFASDGTINVTEIVSKDE